MKQRKINKNAHILQLQAKDVYYNDYVVRDHNKKRRYKGSFDYSIDMIKLSSINKDFTFVDGRKTFSEDVISICFDYKIKGDKNSSVSTSMLRKNLYKYGFDIEINGKKEHYVRFKRSSGSARLGKVLFIKEKYYDQMMDWSYMGLDVNPEKEIDLASLEAYIALTTSSIIDTLCLSAESILVIDDYYSGFTDKVMATRNEQVGDRERLATKIEDLHIENNIWDGQTLLDSSVFLESGYSDKSMLLLRNRFFKSACFNTEIQDFFRDKNITDVSQLNGFTLAKDISQIKMITTPSSIKYMKFGNVEDYLSRLEDTWGIVKYDKPPKYFGGNLVSTHYQLINTLEWTEDEMDEFLFDTVDYVRQLRQDYKVMRNHLKVTNKDKVQLSGLVGTNDFIYAMMHAEGFEKTDMYSNFRRELVKSYIANVKDGHILVEGNYQTLFGNPYEMLMSASGIWNEKPMMYGQSIYTTRFEYGEELLGSRSPHVASSCILTVNNARKTFFTDEIDRYFNLSDHIVVLNTMDNNMLELLSSADFDSDTMLLTNNKVLNKVARKNTFLVANNMVNGTKTPRYNTVEQKSDLDIKTSCNLIGEIINCSQILNSKKFEMKSNGEDISEIYRDICQLNVMSCIAIDMAKKEFPIDLAKELKDIRERWYDKDDNGKVIKPKFFKHVMRGRPAEMQFKGEFRAYNCGMDIMQSRLDRLLKKKDNSTFRRKSSEKRTILSLFAEDDDYSFDRKQLNDFIREIEKYRSDTVSKWLDDELDKQKKYMDSLKLKDDMIKRVKAMNLDIMFIKSVIKIMDTKNTKTAQKLIANKRTVTAMLFESNRKDFIELFNEDRNAFDVLSTEVNGEEYCKLYKKSYYLS